MLSPQKGFTNDKRLIFFEYKESQEHQTVLDNEKTNFFAIKWNMFSIYFTSVIYILLLLFLNLLIDAEILRVLFIGKI